MQDPPSGVPIHVIGASGRSGRALCRALAERGRDVIPIVRDATRWAATGLAGDARLADLTDPATLHAALTGAARIVSCTHARHAPAIMAAAPAAATFVLLGSTRRFTRWPDDHARGVLAGEAAFIASGRSGVMLHPTMIYGATGENNVRRLAALLRRLPVVPLPDGGRALVQPIHQDDVIDCILAALEIAWGGPHSRVIAGAVACSYAEFVGAVGLAAGLGRRRIVSVDPRWLRALVPMLRWLPGLPDVGQDEIRRLGEDKAFADNAAPELLHRPPITLAEGLRRTFLARA